MTDITNIYKKYQAQTFPSPSLLHVKSANGSYIIDYDNKEYLDFVAGVSACSIGHCNKHVTTAVQNQINKYSVDGEIDHHTDEDKEDEQKRHHVL